MLLACADFAIKTYGVRILLWFLSVVFSLDHVTWDDKIVEGLVFVEDHVLQVPLFLMTLMRYMTPTLDQLYARKSRSSHNLC